jgi:methionyl-tRNA formyltransferase
LKIVLLATDTVSTWLVVNALRADHSNLLVALERPISRRRLLRNRIRKQGLATVLGQLAFMLYLQLFRHRSQKQVALLLSGASLSAERPADLEVSEFESMNSHACHAWLRQQAPDVVVVNGTRVLSPQTLTACSAVFLNTHCGITPAYRGVHGGYWALAQGDVNNAGVTVHVVDAGIDTGEIVYQQTFDFDRQDNFLTYPIRQYLAAIPLLSAALNDLRAGTLKTWRRDDLPSELWYHPTLWQYLWIRLLRGVH